MAESNDKDPSIHKVISKRIRSTDGGYDDKQDLDWKLAIPSYLYHNILKPSFPFLLPILVDVIGFPLFGFRSSLLSVSGGLATNAFPLPPSRSSIVVGSIVVGSILYASFPSVYSYSFGFGKSGNTILDKFISERRLKWIPYDKFTNVVYLDKGGFSTIYKAIWLDTNQNRVVVLKRLNHLNENLDEFLNEWKCHQSCSNSYEIINLYGFTKSSDTLNYMVVMDYANKGNLRGNLAKVIKYNWKQKLNMLYKIISGLYEIHEQDLIHCDLHDGNILNHGNKKDEEEEENEVDNNLVFVSDLGLCQPVKSSLKKGEIYGVIPFMAPEVLRGKPYTPASDIYSFSMIMWEFTSGVPPFNDRTHDLQLSLSICEGERPKIIENIPKCYMELMKKCWNEDPLKRPTASEVKYIIGNWIFQPIGNGINEELENNKMEFINAQIGHNDLTTESHPQACYTSRLLNFTSEKLNEILESVDSQSYSSTGITEDLNDCIVKI